MLSNAYFLAKFRFDTAENEPAKNLQKIAQKIANFANFANRGGSSRGEVRRAPDVALALGSPPRPGLARPGTRIPRRAGCRSALRSKFSAKFRSFSAVSAPIFARKYAFCRIFQNLPDNLAEIFEI